MKNDFKINYKQFTNLFFYFLNTTRTTLMNLFWVIIIISVFGIHQLFCLVCFFASRLNLTNGCGKLDTHICIYTSIHPSIFLIFPVYNCYMKTVVAEVFNFYGFSKWFIAVLFVFIIIIIIIIIKTYIWVP